jgi:hypothetical protein
MSSLTSTGSGLSVLVTDMSACVVTAVVSVSLLLVDTMSAVEELTVAVLETVEPSATLAFTLTTSVNTSGESAGAKVGLDAVTVPVPPTGGVFEVHPAGAVKLTKVVPAGTTS